MNNEDLLRLKKELLAWRKLFKELVPESQNGSTTISPRQVREALLNKIAETYGAGYQHGTTLAEALLLMRQETLEEPLDGLDYATGFVSALVDDANDGNVRTLDESGRVVIAFKLNPNE